MQLVGEDSEQVGGAGFDVPTNGPEVTFAVDDVDAVVRAVRDHGGRVLMEKATIPGVGDLAFFVDPSGDVIGAMRYASR